MKNKVEKTNVCRVLDAKKVQYQMHTYEPDGSLTGQQIADILGENPSHVFKTLVTVGKTGNHYVFDVPVMMELDLKKAAAAVGEKNIEMITQKELLPLTGYVHGGCSPIGMKKQFTTVMDSSAKDMDKIFVSGGKLGCQVELSPADLEKVVKIKYENIVK